MIIVSICGTDRACRVFARITKRMQLLKVKFIRLVSEQLRNVLHNCLLNLLKKKVKLV